MRPQETPRAKISSKDKSRKQGYMIEYTSDTLAGRVDGHTFDLQGAAQSMNEENQGSRSYTPNPYHDIRRCFWYRQAHPWCVRPSGRTIWERALVRSQRSGQARRPPTPAQLTNQVHPGCSTHNPEGWTNERVRAFSSARNLRLQKTAICSETRKRMQ